MCATRYALRGERGFRSYRSAAISNGRSPYIEFAPANISTKNTRCRMTASGVFCRACGTAHADTVGQLHSQIRSTSAKQPPSLRGRRPWQSASPAVQRTARPRRGRKENGLPEGELPEGQERPPWGAGLRPRNDSGRWKPVLLSRDCSCRKWSAWAVPHALRGYPRFRIRSAVLWKIWSNWSSVRLSWEKRSTSRTGSQRG